MYKLRQTWIELFPNDVLLKLDLAVNSIDPAWPITAVRPVVGQQAVHLNPDFLNKAKVSFEILWLNSRSRSKSCFCYDVLLKCHGRDPIKSLLIFCFR